MKQWPLLQFKNDQRLYGIAFLNFIEQRTRIVSFLWLGRASAMYSHERPSFHVRSSFASSSVYGTLLFFRFNGAWRIPECAAVSRLMSNAAGHIGK